MKTNKETINSIKNHLATLYSLKPDCKAKLDIMGTSQEMSDRGESYDAGEDMTDWAQRIAHKDADGHYIYDPVTGKVESDIPWEERNWKKLGFDTQPEAILEAFDYSKGLIEEYTTAGKLPDNMSQMFLNYSEVLFFPDVEDMGISTANVTNWTQCFEGSSLTTIGKTLDVSGTNNLSRMFYSCAALVKCPIMNVSHITQFSDNTNASSTYGIFSGCLSLQDASGLIGFGDNSTRVYDMLGSFSNCRNLTKLPIINMRDKTYISNMFNNCQKLTTEEFNGKMINVPLIVAAQATFQGCSSLTELDLISWDFSNCITLNNTFRSCPSLETVKLGGTIRSGITHTGCFYDTPALKHIWFDNTNSNATSVYNLVYTGGNRRSTGGCTVHLSQATYNGLTTTQRNNLQNYNYTLEIL